MVWTSASGDGIFASRFVFNASVPTWVSRRHQLQHHRKKETLHCSEYWEPPQVDAAATVGCLVAAPKVRPEQQIQSGQHCACYAILPDSTTLGTAASMYRRQCLASLNTQNYSDQMTGILIITTKFYNSAMLACTTMQSIATDDIRIHRSGYIGSHCMGHGYKLST